eukprot:459724-Prorocentrum_minimum.AAC.2
MGDGLPVGLRHGRRSSARCVHRLREYAKRRKPRPFLRPRQHARARGRVWIPYPKRLTPAVCALPSCRNKCAAHTRHAHAHTLASAGCHPLRDVASRRTTGNCCSNHGRWVTTSAFFTSSRTDATIPGIASPTPLPRGPPRTATATLTWGRTRARAEVRTISPTSWTTGACAARRCELMPTVFARTGV